MISNWLYVLLLAMTFCGALGAACFKFFAVNKRKLYVPIGLLFYGLGALINIYLLTELPYTIVLPANALTFIWTLIFAKWIFKESIGRYKMIGMIFIVCGLIILLA
ncbi:EamA family transporter [Paenibacillus sp. PAMC21692]|uniref:EamA family transporter n=1 Tax=Paenibacillus sp. PAMC21692 TaxID=2762320 RepID=UPI00164D4EED|nr:EamA family transporter [Paenibacillus sp. PAMC21692]QNK57599.1 EamA family transporter [Paenibacillus sp. PAMC21692]